MLWCEHSRVVMQNLIKDGRVCVDDVVCRRAAQTITAGQWLSVDLSAVATPTTDCAAEDIALDIVHEDAALIIVNKPAGMVVHPGHGNSTGTLMAALLHHHTGAVNLVRGGIVHRLDKGTSGLLAAAKTPRAQNNLIAQFKRRDIGREYLALVHGEPPATGVINLPLGRDRRAPTRMAARFAGKESITRFSVEKRWNGFALLRCRLETGRTHQIRVHLEHNGYPLVGDPIYRRRARPSGLSIQRQALHATLLRLCHPANGEQRQWQAPPPPDMLQAIRELDEKPR